MLTFYRLFFYHSFPLLAPAFVEYKGAASYGSLYMLACWVWCNAFCRGPEIAVPFVNISASVQYKGTACFGSICQGQKQSFITTMGTACYGSFDMLAWWVFDLMQGNRKLRFPFPRTKANFFIETWTTARYSLLCLWF